MGEVLKYPRLNLSERHKSSHPEHLLPVRFTGGCNYGKTLVYLHHITCSLTSTNCVCALSACRNAIPKLQEMFNKERSLDDMVCVKSVKNNIHWRV